MFLLPLKNGSTANPIKVLRLDLPTDPACPAASLGGIPMRLHPFSQLQQQPPSTP